LSFKCKYISILHKVAIIKNKILLTENKMAVDSAYSCGTRAIFVKYFSYSYLDLKDVNEKKI
jgi:hypothetical protein